MPRPRKNENDYFLCVLHAYYFKQTKIRDAHVTTETAMSNDGHNCGYFCQFSIYICQASWLENIHDKQNKAKQKWIIFFWELSLPTVQHWLALLLLTDLTAKSHWKFWSSSLGSHLVCISCEPWDAPFVSMHNWEYEFFKVKTRIRNKKFDLLNHQN